MTFKIDYINGETVVACDTTDQDFRIGLAEQAVRWTDALLYSLRRAYGDIGFDKVLMATIHRSRELLDGAADLLTSDEDSEAIANRIFSDEWLIGTFDASGMMMIATGSDPGLPAAETNRARLAVDDDSPSGERKYAASFAHDELDFFKVTASTDAEWFDVLAKHACFGLEKALSTRGGRAVSKADQARAFKLNSVVMSVLTGNSDELSIPETSDLVFGRENWWLADTAVVDVVTPATIATSVAELKKARKAAASRREAVPA